MASAYHKRLLLMLVLVSAASVAVNVTLWLIQWSLQPTDGDLDTHNTCNLLVHGDPVARSRAMEVMETHHVTHFPEDATGGNCSDFRRNRKFIMEVSEEEKAFPLAFSILMYKDAEQVQKLLRAIYRPHNHYCVHVDAKADPEVKDAMAAFTSCLPGVFMAPHPVVVVWEEFSVLEAELLCMEALLRQPKWRYFINLSGQEFPLKTNLEIVRILKAIGGANVVDAFINSTTYAHRWESVGPPPPKIRLFKGASHVGLTRQFVSFALHDVTAKALAAWSRKTSFPEETFFNSLNYSPDLRAPGGYNGPLDAEFLGGFMRYKKWDHQNLCAGKIVRHVCIFGVADLPRLTASDALFANKLHWDFQPLALDCLEAWYHDLVAAEQGGWGRRLDLDQYSRRPFVQHHVPADSYPELDTDTAMVTSRPKDPNFPDTEDVDKDRVQ